MFLKNATFLYKKWSTNPFLPLYDCDDQVARLEICFTILFIQKMYHFCFTVVIIYTEILIRKFGLWCFLTSKNSTFWVKISVLNIFEWDGKETKIWLFIFNGECDWFASIAKLIFVIEIIISTNISCLYIIIKHIFLKSKRLELITTLSSQIFLKSL